ncbi:hypothetical protein GCM10011416_10370 [Polaribacter pacificus]|uniref:Outer membrane protein beta-barrel domain-containing protein n=1 Tax=Polaribacter pacificus TaxID=1775173 RepID=A0A917HY15_9FLAO|nr:porin family protein [Polaribacter pacificus]GGG94865.1 hypothetical protein GCM10011416_10370 [Polaribacter pacificus]
MKQLLTFVLLFMTSLAFSQKDSLRTGDRYLEDQLYLTISYNQLYSQPALLRGSGFSYGFSMGYIRDIPLVKSGHLAFGAGLGFGYDSFNHGLKVTEQNNQVVFDVDAQVSSNPLRIHTIELPFEFRWRTSTANKFKFWRVYAGIKLSYNLKNQFSYDNGTTVIDYNNVDRFNNFQYGLTLSTGYAAFNFHVYYGLTPLLKESALGTPDINTKVIKMGLIFYIL